MEYPVPSYAAYIWLVGDQFHVGFPPLPGFHQGHTVVYPASDKGLQLLAANLRSRNQHSTIGTKGEPTRYAIERALAGDKRYNEILRAMVKTDLDELLEDLIA